MTAYVPLRVTAHLAGGIAQAAPWGIALDGLLASAMWADHKDAQRAAGTPTTPLHDGAVILEEDRIAAAACFLPLSSNPSLSTRSGTRHRAALGISEETDALAVVVSEETGRISVAIDGELHERLDARGLRGMLYRYLVTPGEEPARERREEADSRAESAA